MKNKENMKVKPSWSSTIMTTPTDTKDIGKFAESTRRKLELVSILQPTINQCFQWGL